MLGSLSKDLNILQKLRRVEGAKEMLYNIAEYPIITGDDTSFYEYIIGMKRKEAKFAKGAPRRGL